MSRRTLLALACAMLPATATAATNVPAGNLVGPAVTWNLAGSPYLLDGDLVVPPGVSLTVEAGVEVKFKKGDVLHSSYGVATTRTELIIRGTLNVTGSTGSPATFTSNEAAPAAGDWYGILALAGSSLNVAGADVRWASRGLSLNGLTGVSVSGTTVRNASGEGVYASGSSGTLAGLKVHNNSGYGVAFTDSSMTLTGSQVFDNGGRGVSVVNGGGGAIVTTLTKNTILGNGGYGVFMQRTASSGSLNVPITNNIVVNNGTYGLFIDTNWYGIVATSTYNLVWGQPNNHSNVNAGTGVVVENPLFSDLAGRDLRITSNSPARKHASDGSDLGALAWDGAATTVGVQGHLYANDTWSGTVDVLGDVTVEPAVTLTILPGTTVRFAANADSMGGNANSTRTELRVLGVLDATGTSGSGIVLNGGGAATPVWAGVYLFASAGTSVMDYVTVREAITGATSDAPNTVTIRNSTFEKNGTGVTVSSGAIQLSGLIVRSNTGYGVSVNGGSPTLSGSRLYDNGGRGVSITSGLGVSHTVTLTKNTIVANGGYGVFMQKTSSSGTLSVPMTNNIVVNNGTYGLFIDTNWFGVSATSTYNLVWGQSLGHSGPSAGAGVIIENPLFADLAGRDLRITSNSPARKHASDGSDLGALAFDGAPTGFLAGHLFDNLTLTAAGSPYLVTGDLTVEPGITLTVQPGVTVKFAANADVMAANANTSRTELRVEGTLLADATASTGIVLQSDASTPAAGQWYGVELLAGSVNSLLDYVTIRHAMIGALLIGGTATISRSTVETNSTGLQVDGANTTLSGNIVRNSTGFGVSILSGSPTISDSQIYGNGGRGVSITSGSGVSQTVTLTKNTIVANGGYGVFMQKTSSSGTLSVPITNNIVVNNGSYGLFVDTNWFGISATSTYNLAWGQTTNHGNVTAGTGVVVENPLFVNEAGRDLRITSNSPARKHASDGSDMGALAYDNASPTVGVQGHLYVDTTWMGTIDVLGDVTVEPGVKLTIADGATVRLPKMADSMGGNALAARTEIRVLGNLDVQGSASGRVRFVSNGATPAQGDWWGIWLGPAATASTVAGSLIQHATTGVVSSAGAGAQLRRSEVTACSGAGVTVQAGALASDGITVHHNLGYGVVVDAGTPTFKNMVVYANGGRGFSLHNAAGTAVTANIQHSTVVANAGYGIFVQKTASSGTLTVTAASNIVAGNGTYGIYLDTNWFTATVTLRYNDVSGQSIAHGNVTAGTGTITTPPLFVDEAGFNFHLQPSSPCIDSADPASTVTSDVEGATRPLDGGGAPGAVVDIGAFEYNPNANKWPVANAGPDRTVISGTTVTFDGSGSSDPDGSLTDYAWDFGDGSAIAHGVSVTHTFAGGTDRVVTLTVTDNSSATATDQANIKVNLRPVAEAGPDKNEDVGIVVLFSSAGSADSDGSIASFCWDFGDGTQTVCGANVSHTFTQGGDFTVTLTVTDNDGATGTDTTIAHIFGATDANPPTITHTPIAAGQPEGVAVPITATVTDATGVGSVSLYYRTEGAGTYTKVAMSAGGANSYSATIPAGTVALPAVQYYLEATDTAPAPNTGVNPSGAPATPHRFTVKDATPPLIVHVPIGNGQTAGQAVTVSATVTDSTGVASVTLYYRVSGGSTFTSTPLTGAAGSYSAQIPAGSVTAAGVDYYLTATDTASPANAGAAPSTAPAAFYAFTVADRTGPSISHSAIVGPKPDGQAVTVTAVVTDASGVASVGLSYRKTGTSSYARVAMTSGASNTWTGTIPAGAVVQPGVDYYLEATDSAAQPNTSTSPAPGATAPYSFAVTDQTAPVIAHTPIADGQQTNLAVTVTAGVTDNVAVASVLLYYRTEGTSTFNSVTMSASGNTYTGQIPASVVKSPAVEYYLDAEDGSSNTSTSPTGAPLALHRFTVTAGDTAAPTIAHTPIADGRLDGQAVSVTATITDGSGVASAKLYYRTKGTASFAFTVMTASSSTYLAQIPASVVKIPGVDYYLEAADSASPANTGTAPAGGSGAPYTFTVVPADTQAPAVTHTPIANGRPVSQPVTVDATITDDVGVAAATLYYRTTGTSTFNSTAMTNSAGNAWSAQIPGPAVTVAGVDYYLEAKDAAGNAGKSPATAPTAVHAFTVAPAVQLQPGDLVITEILNNPSGTETDREWFEVYNSTGTAIDLQGLVFSDTGSNTFTVGSSVVVQAKGFAVLGRLADKARNGNVTVSYEYGTKMSLNNTGDSIIITSGSTEIDRVVYGAGFPYAVDGKSMTLEPSAFNRGDNDTAANWCSAKTQIAGGTDFGTPGAANDPCVVADTQGPAVVHTPIANGQKAGAAVAVNATVTDATGVASVTLTYRVTGSGTWSNLPMTAGGASGWSAQIPDAAVTTAGVDYYLTAVDTAAAANTTVAPATAPGTPYKFTVTTTDTSGPSITHVPHTATELAGTGVPVTATITDASGVASATLHYRTGSGAWSNVALTAGAGGSYSGTIPGSAVQPPKVDYYLKAVDGSSAANASQLPPQGETAPFTFVVRAEDTTPPVIAHTPVLNDQLVNVDVPVTARVTDDTGVASVQVFYRVTGVATWQKAALAATGSDFRGVIPAAGVSKPSIEYYLEAVDTSDQMNLARSPTNAPAVFHTFTVVEPAGGDTTPPTIAHTVVEDGVASGVGVTVDATVTDSSGVRTVELYYRASGTTDFEMTPMSSTASGLYAAEIPGALVTPAGVDYFLRAVDGSAAKNVATSPKNAPAAFHSFVAKKPAGGADAGAEAQADAGSEAPAEAGCGCGAAGAPLSALGLAIGLLALLRRRR